LNFKPETKKTRINMSKEKIELQLTKKQYKVLLKIIFCGEWMLNSHKEKIDKAYKETEEVEQEIFALAKQAGLEKWIVYDENLKQYFPTQLMEAGLFPYVDKYDARKIRDGY
jgi:hypothetical protein